MAPGGTAHDPAAPTDKVTAVALGGAASLLILAALGARGVDVASLPGEIAWPDGSTLTDPPGTPAVVMIGRQIA